MSRSDQIRAQLPSIAADRLRGATWSEIAVRLAGEGISISENQLRPYWQRLADGRHPAEILLAAYQARGDQAEQRAAATAESAEVRLRALSAVAGSANEAEALRNQVAELQGRIAELEADLRAVRLMDLGAGVGRRARRSAARYSGL